MILAVMAALIAGGIQSGGDRNAKLEAQRFIAVVNEVRDEAVISGKNILLSLDETQSSYEFTLQHNQDTSVSESLFEPRLVHKSVSLKWEVFEHFISDQGNARPQVLISSLGELTPFRARFMGEERDFLVALNEDGELFMESKASGNY